MSSLQLGSDTLAGSPASGQVEYNGQYYGTDSNSSRGQFERLAQGTSVTASGTNIDFTGIPSWVKRITVMFNGISTSGTSVPIIQIGSGSTPETSSYLGSFSILNTAVATANHSTGFALAVSGAAQAATTVKHGIVILSLLNSSTNLWSTMGILGQSDIAQSGYLGGSKSITGSLGIVRLTTVNGTDTFDAGSINILYEG